VARYRYSGRKGDGEAVDGVLEAVSTDAVLVQLEGFGIIPLEIDRVGGEDDTGNAPVSLFRKRPDLTELILFTRQMYSLMHAGVPINRAMIVLIRSSRNPILIEALKEIHAQLESGRELSSAMSLYPGIFPSLYVSMVRVGENTGRLDEALMRVAGYLEREKDTRQKVKSALRYPSFVLIAIAAAVTILNIFVIPAFKTIFERAHTQLPLPTRILIGTSDFFVDYWAGMLVVVVLAVIGARWYVATERGRYRWDRYKLRIPIAGNIIERAVLGRFARAFAMATSAGVPLLQTLAVLSKAVDNEYIGGHIADMRHGIERGDTLTRTAVATGMFSPLVIQMLSIGEETGAVDDLMVEVADFYEREVDYDVRNLSTAIEPIMITVIAVMVLILALGIFLPMWDLASISFRHG